MSLILAAFRKRIPAATELVCTTLESQFAQIKTFMQICGNLHGFSISTILCSPWVRESKQKRSSFAGDEHECIERNESFVEQGGRGQVLAGDAVCQSGTGATGLRPNSKPTRERRLASDVGDTRSVRSAARSSQRTAGGESPHGANGVTTEGY